MQVQEISSYHLIYFFGESIYYLLIWVGTVLIVAIFDNQVKGYSNLCFWFFNDDEKEIIRYKKMPLVYFLVCVFWGGAYIFNVLIDYGVHIYAMKQYYSGSYLTEVGEIVGFRKHNYWASFKVNDVPIEYGYGTENCYIGDADFNKILSDGVRVKVDYITRLKWIDFSDDPCVLRIQVLKK